MYLSSQHPGVDGVSDLHDRHRSVGEQLATRTHRRKPRFLFGTMRVVQSKYRSTSVKPAHTDCGRLSCAVEWQWDGRQLASPEARRLCSVGGLPVRYQSLACDGPTAGKRRSIPVILRTNTARRSFARRLQWAATVPSSSPDRRGGAVAARLALPPRRPHRPSDP